VYLENFLPTDSSLSLPVFLIITFYFESSKLSKFKALPKEPNTSYNLDFSGKHS
jgi:hypothetical protein